MSDVTAASDPDDEIVIEEERRRVNGTGLSALIIVLLAFVAPLVIGFGGATAIQQQAVDAGESVIGTLLAFTIAAVVAVSLDLVGIVVGIIALFRKNRGKVLAFVALGLGLVPIVVVALGLPAFNNVVTGGLGQ